MIRGLRKDASREECIEYINTTADNKVKILGIHIISREYSPWLTVAVELNTQDYELLSDINIWEPSIGIREYVGWRHWHGKRPIRLKPHEITGSVRMSWEKPSRTTL